MKSPRYSTIDCGASRVCRTEFTLSETGRPILEDFEVEPITESGSDDNEWVAAVEDILRRMRERDALKGDVWTVLPGHLSLVKFIKVPNVDEAQRRKIVEFEARQNIPYPLSEVVWDYQFVSTDGADLDVALTAVKLETIEDLCERSRVLGVSLARMEPSWTALINALRFNYPEAPPNLLFISIGARSTNLIFLQPDRYFVRNIPVAGNSVSQGIANATGKSFQEAEAYKVHPVQGEGGDVGQVLATAADQFGARLALEVTRSLATFRRQTATEAPEKIFIAGGGARLIGLEQVLHERLRLPVEGFDPLRKVILGPGIDRETTRVHAHQMTEAVGAALGACDFPTLTVDLLPPAVVRRRRFRRQQPFFIAALALAAGALSLPIMTDLALRQAYQERIAAYEVQLRPLERLSGQIRTNLAAIQKVLDQMNAIKGLVETKSNWINFLTDLQSRLVEVEDVWLERLEVTRASGGGAQRSIASSLFGSLSGGSPQAGEEGASLRLTVTGRLLDQNNPLSKVSRDSYNRVKDLLASFSDSQFIVAVENERFDNTQEGILRFDFTLVVDPERPL
jgi:type IV pilus assembly protein PilM